MAEGLNIEEISVALNKSFSCISEYESEIEKLNVALSSLNERLTSEQANNTMLKLKMKEVLASLSE